MATAFGQTVRTYAELTKPRLLPLVLVTGLPALAMASGEWPGLQTTGFVLLGIALAAAAARTFNAMSSCGPGRPMSNRSYCSASYPHRADTSWGS